MKYIVYTLACVLLFVSCNEKAKNITEEEMLPPRETQVDTLIIRDYKAVVNQGPFEVLLSKEEMAVADSLLLKSVENYNKNSLRPINLRYYIRQYVVEKTDDWKKTVTIYGSCSVGGDSWRSWLMEVKDGGDCYFEVEINLTDKTFGELMPHGEA